MFSFMITKEFNFRINFDVVSLSTHIIRKRILKRKAIDIWGKNERNQKICY